MRQRSPWKQNRLMTKTERYFNHIKHPRLFILRFRSVSVLLSVVLFTDYRVKKTCLVFVSPLQNKMQTDQDEIQGQGDNEKEAEDKSPRENEEMEVRWTTVLLVN